MTDLSDLLKRADKLLLGRDRHDSELRIIRDLIARLDDADKRGQELVREQTERRIGLRR